MSAAPPARAVILCLVGAVGVSGAAVGAQEARPTSDPKYAEAIQAGRETIRAVMRRSPVPGMGVAVAVEGKVVWSEGFGFADLEHMVPATAQTKFGIGSNSKALTTALLGRLVDEGLLDLDAPIERYLPEFPHRGKGITVRLVAGHLSGLDDIFSSANSHTNVHYPTTADALREIFREPLEYEPRQQHFYSTGAYTLLAGVVERVTGETFLAAMEKRVLQPLGLRSTVPNNRQAVVPHRTSFYILDDNRQPVHAPFYDPSFKWAGAGYVATAEDLARLGSALLRPGFLKAETLRQLLTPLHTASGENTSFGLGWRIGAESGFGMDWIIGPDDKPRRIIHHPGGGPGISSWVVMDVEKQIVVVILSNRTGAQVGGQTMDAILEAFLKAHS